MTEIETSTVRHIAYKYGADGMSNLDEPFGGLSVDASHSHARRLTLHLLFHFDQVDPGDDVDIVVGKAVASISSHEGRILKRAA